MSDGWDHIQQSIATILTTPLGTRVMRRDYGSEIPRLVDRPMTEPVIMAVFVAAAMALEPRLIDGLWYGEPRFKLTHVEILHLDASGRLDLRLHGKVYPYGHLGDFSLPNENMTADYIVSAA